MIIISRLRSYYNIITGSIAFYPTFYAITAILIAFLMKIAEVQGISNSFEEYSPSLVVNDVDTARNILTTLIAGGLSMLVFSFSMVMLLLSQAAANYSPRVLPNLIANRRHQTILGTFLATILYNIITVIGIEPRGEDYPLPGFSVLLGIISAIIALGAFVYFIHSISTSIQINKILKNIYSLSRKGLQSVVDSNRDSSDFPETSNWPSYCSNLSGTIQNMSISGLLDVAKEYNTKLELLIIKGEYVYRNQPILKSEKELDDEQWRELHKNFNFIESELVSDNYLLGFKQITEIAVKAMSPGINDPGTALDTVDYITELLALRLQMKDSSVITDQEDNPIINLKTISFSNLIYNVLAPYRTYCKHDVSVMQKLLGMIAYLKTLEVADESFSEVLDREAGMMINDSKDIVKNPIDLGVLQGIYDRMEITVV